MGLTCSPVETSGLCQVWGHFAQSWCRFRPSRDHQLLARMKAQGCTCGLNGTCMFGFVRSCCVLFQRACGMTSHAPCTAPPLCAVGAPFSSALPMDVRAVSSRVRNHSPRVTVLGLESGALRRLFILFLDLFLHDSVPCSRWTVCFFTGVWGAPL